MPTLRYVYRTYKGGLTSNTGQIQNHGGNEYANLITGVLGDTSTGWPSTPSGFTFKTSNFSFNVGNSPSGSYCAKSDGTQISGTSGTLTQSLRPYLIFHSGGTNANGPYWILNLSFSISYTRGGVTAGNPIYATDFTNMQQSATKGNVITHGGFTKGAVIKASDWNNHIFEITKL